jgi:hypothetical protein
LLLLKAPIKIAIPIPKNKWIRISNWWISSKVASKTPQFNDCRTISVLFVKRSVLVLYLV